MSRIWLLQYNVDFKFLRTVLNFRGAEISYLKSFEYKEKIEL